MHIWTPYILSVYSLVDGHLGCLLFLAIMNNTGMNIYVQVFVWAYVFISFEYIPQGGIARSYAKCYV